jgi:hypothetical protein
VVKAGGDKGAFVIEMTPVFSGAILGEYGYFAPFRFSIFTVVFSCSF